MNINSNRLKDIASLIEKSITMADIGTDHGYLPIYLVSNNIVNHAYACDVAIGPLNKAKENIINNNLTDKIDTVLTDGLKGLDSKIDQIVIAGMGGDLIVKILKDSVNKYQTLILQPNTHSDKVRHYLINNGYEIVDELVSYENRKYYDVIKAKIGSQLLDDISIKYGPINISKKEKTFIDKLNELKKSYNRIISNFEGSINELNRIKNEITIIDNILKEGK